jgi:squalene synthase HpnC
MTVELSPTLETPSGKSPDTENFPVGSFLIHADLRPHVHAYYRFARDADDISDNALLEPSEKIRRLDRFAEVLAGRGDDVAAAVALRDSLAQTGISARHGLDLLHAFKQDAVKLRYRNWDELMEYCRYSANPVGRYVLALHSVGETAWPSNDALCSALQVINHIQDCADDYREMDRIYLLQEDFEACAASTAMLAAAKASAPLRKVIDLLLERTRPLLAEAKALPKNVPDIRLKLETSIIVVLAEDLVRLLAKRDPLSENVKLSRSAILWAVCKGVVRAFF